MRNLPYTFVTATVLAAWATTAVAADTWLTCGGTVSKRAKAKTERGINETKSISDIYAYNDELNGLYLYSAEKRRSPPALNTPQLGSGQRRGMLCRRATVMMPFHSGRGGARCAARRARKAIEMRRQKIDWLERKPTGKAIDPTVRCRLSASLEDTREM